MGDLGAVTVTTGADFLEGSAVRPVDGSPGLYRGEIANEWRIFYAFGGMTIAVAARAAVAAVTKAYR